MMTRFSVVTLAVAILLFPEARVYAMGAALKGQPLEPLTKFRQTHRKTIDGRLCAGAYVHNSQAFTDCTTAANPEGIADREWCYVEEQAANAGPQKWDYCAPKINYADVRTRVQHAFVEKANEIADAISVVQRLSKEGTSLVEEIKAQCA